MMRRDRRKLGATGKYPQGVLNAGDQGELKMAIRHDPIDGLIHVEFGTPVAWFALPPESAIELAKKLMIQAGVKRIEISI